MSTNLLIDDILGAIQRVIPDSSPFHKEPLHEPNFNGTNAHSYVRECIDTGWVSSAGRWVSRFENDLASFTGASHAIAVNNGTVALRLALHAAGVSRNDEVIIPPLSFVATANAVSHLGAVPHFVDIEEPCLGLDPDALDSRLNLIGERKNGFLYNRVTGRKISAVIVVHVFGFPADAISLKNVCDHWGLPLVEDAAEALGSWDNNIHCGLVGVAGVLSFNGNKLITTGGGGAVITNNEKLAHDTRHLSTTAKLPHPWEYEHDQVGWNDRLPNINAALGVAQLEIIHELLRKKKILHDQYIDQFSNLDGVEVMSKSITSSPNYWLNTISFTSNSPSVANENVQTLLRQSHDAGLLLRPVWKLLHDLPMYSSCPRGDLSIALDRAPRLVNLPSSAHLASL